MNSSWMLPAVTEYLVANSGSITNNVPTQEEDNHQDPHTAVLNVLICSVVLSVLANKAKEDQNRVNENALTIEQQANVMNSSMSNRQNAAWEVGISQDDNNALISTILSQHAQIPCNSAPQGIPQLPLNLLLSAIGHNQIIGPIYSKPMDMTLELPALCNDSPDEPITSECNCNNIFAKTAIESQVKSLSQHQSPALPLTSGKRQKGRPAIFIQELYEMLIALEKEPGGKSIASFQPGGETFAIHRPEKLVNVVLPKYFRMKSISSFKRQLNMYGFRQVSVESEKCAYYHELFIRGQPNLLKNILRIKKKSVMPSNGTSTSL